MSPTVHLVYPHGPGIAAPNVIGRRLGEYLSRRHQVVMHDWDALARIVPSRGDVLIGHPHPVPGTVFRRSFRQSGWSRRLVLSPFNGDARQVAFLDPFVRGADGYLAVTGAYWAQQVTTTRMAHWAPRMTHLDLALDRADFPVVKDSFAEVGRRRILYIGHAGWQKNVGYLSAIAESLPDWDFGWIGRGEPSDIPGVVHHGVRDTSLPETRALVRTYDFLLTVGRGDANPMSVLEAMGWGLIPFCTPQSGYVDEPGIVNVPLDDVLTVIDVLRSWQRKPDAALRRTQTDNLDRLDRHYCWPRFGDQVEAALSLPTAPVDRSTTRQRLGLVATAALSPSGPLRTTGRQLAVAALRRRVAAHRAG